MTATVSTVGYEIAGSPYSSVLVGDPAKHPIVLMAPDWMGAGDGALAMAQTVAAWGFSVLVVDVYGAGKRPDSMEAAMALSAPLKDDQGEVRLRIAAALAAARQHGTCVAAFGFCFGGMNVLELARAGADLALAVSIHGDLLTTRPAAPGDVRGEIMVLHGAADPVSPKAQRDAFEAEMTAAGATWLMTSFGGAVHSFTDPGAAVKGVAEYDGYAAEWSLAMLRRALEQHCRA